MWYQRIDVYDQGSLFVVVVVEILWGKKTSTIGVDVDAITITHHQRAALHLYFSALIPQNCEELCIYYSSTVKSFYVLYICILCQSWHVCYLMLLIQILSVSRLSLYLSQYTSLLLALFEFQIMSYNKPSHPCYPSICVFQ